MIEILPAILVFLLFYVILPLFGAFMVRRKWRFFRKQVVAASLSREVSYSNPDRTSSGLIGCYNFTGELQAIQNDSSIWLNNGKITVRAEMKGVKLYLLPTSQAIENEDRIEENKAMLPQDMPKRIGWESVYSLTQGTGILLFGQIFMENGTPVFRQSEQNPLLVIIYDGKKESILRRSIWSGRQLNEYWNSITPFSLLAGSFSLFVLAYIKFMRPESGGTAILLVVMSLFPLVPFLPPGLFLYFVFRRLWRSGRYLRGERDLLRLPLRFSIYENCESCSEALVKYPDAGLRSCGIINEQELLFTPCRVYIREKNSPEGSPEHVFEHLIIPGDPDTLAKKCRSRARWMEILAAASVGTGCIINLIVIYIAIVLFL